LFLVEDNQLTIDIMDQKILQIMIDHPEISMKAIAKSLGIVENTIYNRSQKPGFIKAKRDLSASTDDLLKRAQRIAARRLLTLIKSKDDKIALEAIKIALAPLNNKKHIEQKTEVIFQTRIGSQGQLMSEMIDVSKNRKEDTLTNPEKPASQPDESTDTPNDKKNKS
jgi:predicted transglutaminase-like protease